MAGGSGWRVVVPTVATAVVSSAVAIVVNLATEWKTNPWAWVGVGMLTLVAAVLAVWLACRHGADAPVPPGVSMSGSVGRDNVQIGQARDVTIDRDR
jgi:hypothetical protein